MNVTRRLLVFPHGNDVDNLSLYLDFVDGKSHGPGFVRDARFTLEVNSQINSRESIKRGECFYLYFSLVSYLTHNSRQSQI